VKLLIDEMYPAALADGLRAAGVQACTVSALKLAGGSDAQVFAAAVAGGCAVLTENVGDFTRIAAEHSLAGGQHHGLLIALSSRFSRRPQENLPLIAAIQAVAGMPLDDRIVYLEQADRA
jgi:predicted nuclease of predicted toxin-antitoxin system